MSKEQRIAVDMLFILSIVICIYCMYLGHRLNETEKQNKILNNIVEKYEDLNLLNNIILQNENL